MNQIVEIGLKSIYPNSVVTVDHDLLACALSTYEGEPSISCILGTGSNSCYYDGKNLRKKFQQLLMYSEMKDQDLFMVKNYSKTTFTINFQFL